MSCSTSGEEKGTSIAYGYTFDGDYVDAVDFYYSDSDCSTLSYYFIFTHTYKTGDVSTKIAEAREIDFQLTQARLVAKTEESALQLRQLFSQSNNEDCKNTKVDIDVATDVTSCGLIPKSNYNVVKVDGSKLIFGNCDADDACNTKDKRATELEDKYATKAK